MTIKPVSKKMGIKDGMRAIFINAPAEAIAAIDSSSLDIALKLTGTFDYIHLFSKSQKALKKHFPKIKLHIQPGGML